MEEVVKNDMMMPNCVTPIDINKSPKLKAYFGVGGVPDCCVIVGTKNEKYVYMQQNGETTTVRSKRLS